MAGEIWPKNEFVSPLIDGCRETLVFQEIPFTESNENIAETIKEVLKKVKEYRDKHYPL